ncbi:hypothetical protein [Pseudomonas zhanjiangensis]|uniref:Lipoprotein n=1 Tax=Pseudomonas zhanjiangensis TaxID=3239015 RepID=A0ABV3YPI7_9PSED
MKAWGLLVALCCSLLSGCLVTFREPIAANEAAPIPLLGSWARTNEWGEQQFLEISRAGPNLYKARTYQGSLDNLDSEREYGFTVALHGQRWYLSAGLPKRLGANFVIAGFELTAGNELVLYNLDVDRVLNEIEQGRLAGETVEIAEGEEGVLISSPMEQVFAYLDDPANSDVFVEVARYQRIGQ